MRAIILAAGQDAPLDGMVKCLVKAPADGRPLLERTLEAFGHHAVTVVVGYRAVEVMQAYPDVNYVYNADWATTNTSHSLALALNDEPSYVVSSDLLFEPELVTELDAASPNLVGTQRRGHRSPTSVNCSVANGQVKEFYVGSARNPADPQTMGLYKITDPWLLREWRRNCLKQVRLLAGPNLPCGAHTPAIAAHDLSRHSVHEIGSPADYLRALKSSRVQLFASLTAA